MSQNLLCYMKGMISTFNLESGPPNKHILPPKSKMSVEVKVT